MYSGTLKFSKSQPTDQTVIENISDWVMGVWAGGGKEVKLENQSAQTR